MEHIKDILQRAKSNTPSHPTTTFPSEPLPCPACDGARLVYPLRETGEPVRNAVVPCRRCTDPAEIARLLNISSLETTFETFKIMPGTRKAFEAAKKLASLKTDWKLLLLYGTVGSGKTHLLEAIANELYRRGMWAGVITFPDLIGRLKSTFDRSKEKGNETCFEEILKRFCTTPFLLLDDVGTAGSYTEFSKQQLERIMLERYRTPLFTVVTTSRDLTELPEMVYDRFTDAVKSRMVLNEGKSYRREKNKVKKGD